MTILQNLHITAKISTDGQSITVTAGLGSNPIEAEILTIDYHENGAIDRIYLDRLIHLGWKSRSYSGYLPTGAISTILVNIADADQAAA